MRLSSVPSLQRTAVAVAAVAAVVSVAGCAGDRAAAGLAAGPASGPASGPADGAPAAVSASGVSASATATPAVRGVPTTPRASAVLHRWDRARAEAFAAGDPAALRALYVPGAAAGTTDVRTLRAYRDRGLRVEGMRMQLLAVRVLEEGPGRLRLEVTDRLTGAVAVGPRGRLRLPSDTASTRVVELVRRDGAWLVAEVSDPGRRRGGP